MPLVKARRPAPPSRSDAGRPRPAIRRTTASRVPTDRPTALREIRGRLESNAHPRLQMTVIVALVGIVGAASSAAMLGLGVDSMAVRYLCASACAYLFFIAALGWWTRQRRGEWHDDVDLGLDLVPSTGGGSSGDGSQDLPNGDFCGGGGDFAGAGASGDFDDPGGRSSAWAASPPRTSGSSIDADGCGCGDIDFADGTLPLVVVAMALVVAFAALYVVWIAPSLMAELLFDGVLSYGLYRHLRGRHGQHWLATALRRTALPFACTAVFLAGTGLAMAVQVPCARSIGDVVHAMHARRSVADGHRAPATIACVRRSRRHDAHA